MGLSSSMFAATTVATAMVAAVTIRYYSLWQCKSQQKMKRIRQKLPRDLDKWRMPGTPEADEQIWKDAEEVFRDRGFTLWPHSCFTTLRSPGRTCPLSSGFGYAPPNRDLADSVDKLGQFLYTNPLTRMVRTREGHDVSARVIVIGHEGHQHLTILRKIATGPQSLHSKNHALPMLGVFQFEDITFGLFPKVGGSLADACDTWQQNSVGDVIDMVMQALEALAYLHDLNIAHQDAFRDNFLVQWHPGSMRTMTIPVSRPRVYLIDFEVAIEFPAESLQEERVCIGLPLGGSFPEPEMYFRPLPLEMGPGKPYNPFKLDVWQLGQSFSRFQTTIPEIDDILADLVVINPELRIDANEALKRLGKVVHAMAPQSLVIQPKILPREGS